MIHFQIETIDKNINVYIIWHILTIRIRCTQNTTCSYSAITENLISNSIYAIEIF